LDRAVDEEPVVEQTFRISETTVEGYSVVSVVGELDVATAPEMRSRLEESIDASKLPAVVADLLGVTFIDSTALGVLIGALKRSQAAGGEFRIVAAEPRILKVFEITGLTELFSIYPTLDEATAG
jgi:anti-sigma B factor antagonist